MKDHFLSTLDVNVRFHNVKFEVSETINTLQDSSSLCAEQVGPLAAGAVQYYPCGQGAVLSIDRSRLFMAGQFVQLRMYTGTGENNWIHVYEIEVHGY